MTVSVDAASKLFKGETMKTKTLLITLMVCTVLSLMVYTGCSKQDTQQNSETAITLVLGIWDKNQEPVMKKLAEAYHARHSDVTVTVQLTPYRGREYWTKLEASAVGGTAPDVFWMNGLNIEKYVEAGLVADLTELMRAQGITGENFPQSLIDFYTFDGKSYGVPKDFDTNALWFNKKLFDEAQVPYPTDNWTWEDMKAAAIKLTDKTKQIYGIAAPLDFQTCYYNTVFGAGGYILNKDKTKSGYDDPKTIEGIQIWVDLINKGASPSFADLTDTGPDALFESGRIAMLWAGSYMTPEYMQNEVIKDIIDLVEAPAYKKKANVINGLAYTVYEKSKHKEAAIDFALWLGSSEAMKIQGESGTVISARKDAQHYFSESQPSINLKAYTNQADLATLLPACYVSSQLFTAEDKWLKQAYAGQISVEEACKNLAKEADKILAQ
ncbi:sugar ABC transporter substrate-binding protein [Treponema phagedenis]|uniref:ABC transporter, solute-binding protein n=2 Tax=Treponema phagedenis TaxID=162 RepID=A0A0B7GQD9_TREPH|nr:sugar ABC transporter substrate-binding protein [Treponema phagedenis]QEJ95576.1 sugar ABC transporter substrate-binding protein [Treponema phagedenis]QEJ99645.1 sugar ABC transporter substrate-binding protein [Treponema phagedenis]QEK02278.1 sugar ABC transporter substrate-binding protein [Treponema phagedenis]QEK05196.1 sugar ABC transporter substrate-binding protein [Treponema phagedenis]